MPSERDLLLSALRHLAGATYDSSVPYEPGSLDCVRFTYAVLRDLWPEQVKPFHDALHLVDASKPFSPIGAVFDAGVSKAMSTEPEPGRWHLCQGWKSLDPLKGGHGWLWYEPATPVLGGGRILQATNARYPWVMDMYWEDQLSKFPHTRLAVLNLT